MQIYVCVKHVPDTAANIKVTGTAKFDESVKFVVNPFDMPVASEAVALELKDGRAVVEREIGGGVRDVIEMQTPCVIGAAKGLNEPRFPKLPDILKAKKKEIKLIDIMDLDIDLSAANSEILGLESVPERSEAKMLSGSPRQIAEHLVDLMKEEAVI